MAGPRRLEGLLGWRKLNAPGAEAGTVPQPKVEDNHQ
jgi:hypothetical protein